MLLQLKCRPGVWFSLSVGLSNEFGLWRRSDFGQSTATSEIVNEEDEAERLPPRSSPSAGTGVEAGETSARLKLVVETRNLEGNGACLSMSLCSLGVS